MDLHPALQKFLASFKTIAPAIVDSYFIVDLERRIVDFNRAFYAMLPRQVARGLKGKRCFEVIELNICKSQCIAQQCWRDDRHVRLDEISGKIQGSQDQRELPANQIRARTVELLETNQLLLKTQKELLQYKKGLIV